MNLIMSDCPLSFSPSFSSGQNTVIAVSYTHLDVYKRQILQHLFQFNFMTDRDSVFCLERNLWFLLSGTIHRTIS